MTPLWLLIAMAAVRAICKGGRVAERILAGNGVTLLDLGFLGRRLKRDDDSAGYDDVDDIFAAA